MGVPTVKDLYLEISLRATENTSFHLQKHAVQAHRVTFMMNLRGSCSLTKYSCIQNSLSGDYKVVIGVLFCSWCNILGC